MRCFGSDLPVKVFCGLAAHTVCGRCYTAAERVCPLCKYLFGGICETNPPSNASFKGTTPSSKTEEAPKKDKMQTAQKAVGEAEGTPKRDKKVKYNCAKGYPAKTPMEDGYKVVVWDPAQAYNPALEEDRVALDYLAATYARYRDLRSNPCAENMP